VTVGQALIAPPHGGPVRVSPPVKETPPRPAATALATSGSSTMAANANERVSTPPVIQGRQVVMAAVAPPDRRSDPPTRERVAASVPAPPSTVPAADIPMREPVREEESRVEAVLRQYARAYGNLDATAARDVWPSVDQRALARAFDSLRSQQLSLQDCQIDVDGSKANASCRGQAQYVGKVGSGEPRIEPRTWRFELRRDGDVWKIANAEARRPTS